jgi:hypothetical protein
MVLAVHTISCWCKDMILFIESSTVNQNGTSLTQYIKVAFHLPHLLHVAIQHPFPTVSDTCLNPLLAETVSDSQRWKQPLRHFELVQLWLTIDGLHVY